VRNLLKKLTAVLFILVLSLSGCGKANKNMTFTGKFDSIYGKDSLKITDIKDVQFSEASVSLAKNCKVKDNNGKVTDTSIITIGDIVKVTILPEIRESFPVQVTAIEIVVLGENDVVQTTAKYNKILSEEAKKMMDSDKDIIILDVRTQAEYEESHIKGAIRITDTELSKLAPSMLPNKDAKILVYCRSGRRSKAAAEELLSMGYTNVYDFGGIIDWNYDTVSGE